ncbi:hypothetical protein Rhe02_56040 [Rhizocola hellebori]|uniref:Uncharacterized protein n=2 Tax=Rhizocola hellebori TaxID=1392758 RepID=A0A8J3QDB0_9ACTN|nr:hypothetical protein Rhe02_56040 [Rhizocola hellebori]
MSPAAASTDKTNPRKLTPTEINTGGPTTQALLIRRNNQNTRASQVSSTLGETAAANEGNSVFYTGNTYASFSNDLGVTWTNVAIPAGPADAPSACCDQDVVRAHGLDRTFSIMLYLNAAGTNGVVRIFVRNAPDAAPLCSYTIDPAGAADNIVPDYPHIGLTANFLYLGNQNLTNGTTWVNSQVRRFNASNMAACVGAATNTLTWTGSVGQRLLMPVEGAANTTTMFFGAIEATNSFRVFTWPESSTTATSVVRTTGTSAFTNPDCRGGTGNFDFIERATSFSAAGFRMRGAVHGSRVTWFWHSAPVTGIAQAHVRAASFRASDSVLLEEPHIFNAAHCFGYPVVSGNVFGALGISIAAGGAAGGGGSAAQGFVGVDDTPADAIHFGTVILTASGTHNRTDGRFGDYFTVRTNARCQVAYVGTNYALLNGNTLSSHVNARYVEFGSTLDDGCF